MRIYLMAGALGALAACQPAIPDSGAGVGFDNSVRAERARQAAAAAAPARPVPAAPVVTAAPLAAPRTGPATASVAAPPVPVPAPPVAARAPAVPASADPSLAEIAAAEDAAAARANSGRVVVNASPANPAPTAVRAAGISDENDFGAVSSRQSIESDKARIAQNRARYQVVQPTDLPTRVGAGPNIVEYALQTKQPKGTKLYTRLGFGGQAKFRRNCAKYTSDDDAQSDFLARGGPTKDRAGLDPDGDGFACGWDPAPFRRAAAN